MKGFKNSTRMSSGFKFPESAGFSSSSGKVQQVRGYTRSVVKKATGGQVPGHVVTKGAYSGDATTVGDQGNSAQLRSQPISEFDKDHGGKGPLEPGLGYAMGGSVGMAAPLRAAVGAVTRSAGNPPAMRTAIPKAGMGRRPLMRAEGGKVPPKKPAPPPPSPTTVDILGGKTRKKQEEDLGLAKGGFLSGLKKGALHKSLGIAGSKKIPAKALAGAADSSSPLMRKRANFAINARKWNHG